MSPALHSVIVEHDTRGVRLLAQKNDPEAGVLVVAAPPDSQRRFEMSWTLLESLGKRHDVTGYGRHDEHNWEVLHAWLLAHRVHTLVVLDAQWLPPLLVGDLAGLVATCSTDVWLVAHHPVSDAYLEALAGWPHRSTPGTELVKVVSRSTAPPKVPRAAAFPDVPADNWPTFRHACATTLSTDEFDRVDVRFRAAVSAARSHFAKNDLDEPTVLAHLRLELDTCETVAEMTTVIRAMQVAAHRCGWLIQVNPARLRNTAELMSRAAVASPETWRRLRAYRFPYRGAAVALSAVNLNVGDMDALTCQEVSEDGQRVMAQGRTLDVTPGADLFIRAQLLYRRIQGSDPSDAFFADDRGPMRPRDLADALRQPASELGVPVIDTATSRMPDPTSARWRDRWGITVQRLT